MALIAGIADNVPHMLMKRRGILV